MNLRLVALMETQGRWLYHRRSTAGVVLLPLLIVSIWFPGYPGAEWSKSAINNLSYVALLVSFAGLALRWLTAASVPADTSVRSTREMRAAQLNTRGVYSVVRHPLYLANGLVYAGFIAVTGSLWFLALFVLFYALYIERVAAAEEGFLESIHGQAWHDWVACTPAFIPAFSHWAWR
ncbi:MAG TPA: isoprenylcysteine carboxylmethyltransferase family protein [Rhodanobacteraceae bacterium]